MRPAADALSGAVALGVCFLAGGFGSLAWLWLFFLRSPQSDPLTKQFSRLARSTQKGNSIGEIQLAELKQKQSA